MRPFSPLPHPTRVSAAVAAAVTGILLATTSQPAHAALTFNLTDGAGLSALQGSNFSLYTQVRSGFNAAADIWSGLLADNVTINVTVDFDVLGAGIIGGASFTQLLGSYDDGLDFTGVRTALVNDADPFSSIDTLAIANLPATSAYAFVGNGPVTLDTSQVSLTKANAKALGAVGLDSVFGAEDANITFNRNFTFDFDRSNGITAGRVDFIGIAVHEIGHALGFISVVDDIEAGFVTGTLGTTTFSPFTMDLYRFSIFDDAPIRDFSAGDPGFDRYFSLDGGATDLDGLPAEAASILFSVGKFFGDGRQASHWQDNSLSGVSLGIMDPTAANSVILPGVSRYDLAVMDAIGWNLTASGAGIVNAPEPASVSLLGMGAIFFGLVVARRQGKRRPRSS